jgi:NADH-quinone oxidoreductase subunit C
VVYHLYSLQHTTYVRLKVRVDENDLTVPSVAGLWASANWHERETYDMFGIKFTGHPDLRRMYMPEEFEYHPLRKDFPLMGIPDSIPLPRH